MGITGIDHVAFPTADAERLLEWYERLGVATEHVEEWRAGTRPMFSLMCGNQKFNVHPEALAAIRGNPAYLRGPSAEPGCLDVCLVWEGGIDALQQHLATQGIEPIEGPVTRHGGTGATGVSIYLRDPDDNLVELISYDPADVERLATGTAW